MLATLLAASISAASINAASLNGASLNAAEPILGGYLPMWQLPAYDVSRLAPLNLVFVFSAQPNKDGGLNVKDLELKELPALVAAKRRYGFRMLLCCGGWERSDGFMSTATSPDFRARFVNEVDAFLTKYRLDGVDLDWEHTTNEAEGKAYGDLIQAFRSKFKGRNRLVTAAIAAWQVLSPDAVRGLDYVNVMSYDHPERHSTMELAQSDVAKLRAMGFPANRIVLGVPLYGHGMKKWQDTMPYSDILKTFKPLPAANEAGDYYYNGPDMVRAKAEFARKEGLAGVFVWEVSHDARGQDSLIGIMRTALGLPK